VFLAAVVFLTAGLFCTPGAGPIESYFNNTASLGGETPGGRGTIQVGFVNNTPFRAIFTLGTYDPLNSEFAPSGGQFNAGPEPVQRLEGNSSSPILSLTCARAVGVGDAGLIQTIQEHEDLLAESDPAALITGIAFSDKPLGDPEDDQPTVGLADGIRTLQGAEFQCESLLVYTFEVDSTEPDGFRIDLTVILP
jgi:hypothetical protein